MMHITLNLKLTKMDYGGFSFNDMKNLTEMVSPEEEDEHVYGSALNPGTLHSGKDKKEIAPPNVKTEIKVNNRAIGGGAKIETIEAEQKAKNLEDPKLQIWTEEEVNVKAEEMPDDRPQPDYEILQRQAVGTEDVFLGLSNKDPSSNCCDSILVKIWLPNTKFANVSLDIKGQSIMVQSPNFVLNKLLPFVVDKDNGKAKFDSDKCLLEVTLPVLKKDIIEQFIDMTFKNPDGQ